MRFIVLSFLILSGSQLLAQEVVNRVQLPYLNSSYDELNPVLSVDGKTLYVTIANRPENVGGKRDAGDIWISTKNEQGEWSTPTHGGNGINNAGFNSVAGFSGDGNRMYLMGHYAEGEVRTQGISVSKRSGAGWSKPENIQIPYFHLKSNTVTGHINPQEDIFVFAAETYGSRGVEDIYVSLKVNGQWQEPKNLGAAINTQFQELSPSISEDGNTLYFSSNGRSGSGSFDVYSVNRLDNTWTNWSTPENLGSSVNSSGRDLYYKHYGYLGIALFTTTTNSDGYGDVRMLQINQTQPLPILETPIAQEDTVMEETTTVVDVTDVESIPVDKIEIYGKVVDAKTGAPVEGSIQFVRNEVIKRVSINKNGYQLEIDRYKPYTISIEATGYISVLEKINTEQFEMQRVEMNFNLQPLELGTAVNLKNVLFEQGKTVLLKESYDELDLVVQFLKRHREVRIEVAGHTDNRGIASQNVKLSKARAEKVKEYLIQKGIEAKRITGKGYGGTKPIANNDDEESRPLNRRVEFIIKKV
jgi:OOP family OmpA-OmpF porin